MSDKVRVGMIGCGSIVGRHVRNLLRVPEAEIVALNDISEASVAQLKEAFPQIRDLPVYDDYRKMLDEVGLDAVVISTPHTLHFQHATDSIDRGLHVLIEKPMVCSVDHARRLMDHAKAKDRVILIAYQRHYAPQFLYIKQAVQEGRIGDVTYVAALLGQDWKRRTAGTWRQQPELSGGGQLNDSGSHLLDIILWITGLAAEEVFAYVDNLGTPVDVNSAVSLRFSNGAQGTVTIVGDAACWYEDFTIWGEKGVFFYRNGKIFECGPDGKIAEPQDMPEGSDADKNFIDVILGRDVSWAPAICGLRVAELTEAAWKSAEVGKPVRVASS